MRFRSTEQALTRTDIAEAEANLGLEFPPAVRSLYIASNGGFPEPYVFEDEHIDTVVAELLPLKSGAKGTALDAYQRLVRNKRVAPQHFLPFAVDGGGDYFFVDCSTPDGLVYFLRGDSASNEQLLSLKIGFDAFWSALKLEE